MFDPSNMDAWIALRNSLGVTIALTIGMMTRQPVLGLVIGLGALNVAFADSREAYAQRLRRMLASTGLCFLAVLLGSVSVYNVLLAGSLASLWGFAAGLVVVLGTTVSELFIVSLTLFIICATQPVPFEKALSLAALTAVGGLVQILLSVSMWTFQRFRAERRALSILYHTLAEAAGAAHDQAAPPFASEVFNQVHRRMASTLRSSSRQSDRYKFLLVQGERIRVSLHALVPFKERVESAEIVDYLKIARAILEVVARRLDDPNSREVTSSHFTQLAELTARFRVQTQGSAEPIDAKVHAEAQRRIDALTGQLRAAVDVTEKLEDASWSAPEKFERLRPLSLQYGSALAALRANLNFKSVACRHATRLAVGVAIGEWLSHVLHVDRAYWIPMTIVIVLKPDYNATISRGLLRIAGTFAGILFSAVLFHYVALPVEVEIIAAGLLMFLLRTRERQLLRGARRITIRIVSP